MDAACRAAGIHRVETPRQLVESVQALLTPFRPRGRRVAVVGDGGGYGAVASDLLGAAGLELPPLAAATQARLRTELPPTASTANPVDLAGAGEQDTFSFSRTTRTLLEDGELDAVLLTAYFGGYSLLSDELREREVAVARELAAAAADTGRPLVVHTMHWDAPPARELRSAGIPVYRAIEAAVAGLATLASEASFGRTPLPELPSPERPLLAAAYAEARDALSRVGISFAAAHTVHTREEALAAAAELGYPVVLKALAASHKSDGGGVVLGLESADGLARSFDELVARLAPRAFSVEAQERTHDGFELLVGSRRDARFGPLIVVGAGGVHAELLRDTAVALAPVDAPEAEAMLRSLRCAPLLDGARGRLPLDVGAAAEVVARISRFAAAHPEIAELEVNPLLVHPSGAVGLDARIVLAQSA